MSSARCAIAPIPSALLRRLRFVLTFRRLPGQMPQIFGVFAQIFRAQQMMRPSHHARRRKVVLPAVLLRIQWASIPSRNVVRPEWIVSLRPTARCYRRFSSAAGEPRELEMKREQNMRKTCRIRTVTPGDLGWSDKANWRSLAPFGRKGLSAHWFLQVLAASKWRGARCAGVALRIFLMNFNPPSDGARNVRRGGILLFHRHHARWCDLMRSMLGSSCVSSFQ